ncbi:MAG: polyamine aminopropyltransferase [Candidatus Pacebacteria bacterium]|nr:polyamine aminopropyltransferase [Candidatus Paceibacterota bacterium]
MPISKLKWFCEGSVPGKRLGKVRHCFYIDKLVFKGRTPYQEILIFDNSVYGRTFVLDGIVQLSKIDEFIYHEIIVHPIMFSHPSPKKVLIVGGGDGGVLREVLKHPIDEVYLIDIDEKLIEICKKYLPFVSQNSFADKRAKINIGDGMAFVNKFEDFFDVVIIDSNDPIGPSSKLFSQKFYGDVFRALKKDGIMIAQIGSFLDFESMITGTYRKLKKIFPFVYPYKLTMPSYNCGDYCFMGASKGIDLARVDFRNIEKRFQKIQKKLKYYSPKIHQASMTLPKIWQIKG